MGKECLVGFLHIIEEGAHLCLRVAFSHVSDVDATGGVGSLLDGLVRCSLVALVMDKYVGRSHLMGEACGHFPSVVVEGEGDIHRILWHRNEEDVLETLGILLSLRIAEPFLEKGREGVAVDDLARMVVTYRDLSISLYGYFAQTLLLAIPMRHDIEFIDCNHLLLHIACKDVVDT